MRSCCCTSTTSTMEEERLGTARLLLRLLLLAWMGARLPLICSVGCGDQTVFHTERRGVIYSPSWPLPYPAALNCSWGIVGARREVITISFRNFDVDDVTVAAGCWGDWLELSSPGWSEQARLCGSVLPSPFISSSGRVSLCFHSQNNSSGQAQGFRLSYIRGHLGQSSCPPDEFLCGNGKCLPLTWKCNGQDECGDATDERGCSPPPTDALPLLRRPPCPPGSSPCTHGPSTLCLPPLLRCDGRRDCPDGSDERGCADTACGKKRLGNFYGSFASPDFYFRVNRSAAVAGGSAGGKAVGGGGGGGEGGGEVRCSWFLDTQDPKPIVLQLDLRLGPADSLHVYDGLVQRAERLLQALSHHNNHRPALLESTRGQMSVLYMAQPHSLGHGFNATYQVKGYCFPGEHPCGGDQGCYSDRQRCDGYWHCPSGRDEEGCPACPAGEYPCEGGGASGGRVGIGSGSGTTCYPASERCNNQKRCPEGSDEKNCFDCQPGNFHCGTNLCIFETWRCDGQEDCLDGSDERDCLATVPRKVITAALIGSLVCGLLLVVALGCAFKLYSLRNREYRAFETQMTRLEAEFVQREAPPSYGQLIAQGLIPPVDDFPVYNPVQSSVLQNLRTAMRRQMRRQSSRRSASRRRLGRLWTRLFQQRGGGGGGTRPHGGGRLGHGIPLLSPPSAPPPPPITPPPPSLPSGSDTWPRSPPVGQGGGGETPGGEAAAGELRLVAGVTTTLSSVATPSPCSVAALELALSLPQFSSEPPTPSSSSSCSSSFSSSPPLSPLPRSSSESQEEEERDGFEARRLQARSPVAEGERPNGRRRGGGGGFEPPGVSPPQRGGDCRAPPACGRRPPRASTCSSSSSSVPSPSHHSSHTTPSHYHPLHPRHRRKASKRLVVGLAVNLTSVSLRRYSPLRHISPTAEPADSV